MPRSSRVPSRLRSALGVALAVSAAAACTPNAAVTPPVGTPSATPTSIASTVPVSGESPSASPSAAVSATPSAATTWKVSGTVLDDERNPVAAASVKAMAGAKEAGSASTDALGKYQLALPPGDYVLVAAKDNFTRREQPLKLAADATADFGPVTPDSGNPYFLSNFPEIVSVDVQEAGTGGPLTLKARLSEPLPPLVRMLHAPVNPVWQGNLFWGAPVGLPVTACWNASAACDADSIMRPGGTGIL